MNRYRLITPHLNTILSLTKSVGSLRVWIISFVFPEFREILGELSRIGEVVDKDIAP